MFSVREKQWFEKPDEPVRSAGFAARVVDSGTTGFSAVGTMVSPSGLAFIVRQAVSSREFDMRIVLRERPMMVRLRIERSDDVIIKAERWFRHFCKFVGIAADDWDAVVRYVRDLPEPTTVNVLAPAEDNEFRLLPIDVQRKIVDALVGAKRLARPAAGGSPLLRFTSESRILNSEGQVVRRLLVESRVGGNREQVARFQSKIDLLPSGEVELRS